MIEVASSTFVVEAKAPHKAVKKAVRRACAYHDVTPEQVLEVVVEPRYDGWWAVTVEVGY